MQLTAVALQRATQLQCQVYPTTRVAAEDLATDMMLMIMIMMMIMLTVYSSLLQERERERETLKAAHTIVLEKGYI